MRVQTTPRKVANGRKGATRFGVRRTEKRKTRQIAIGTL
jgi:hypothetical protein